MKRILLCAALFLSLFMVACEKDGDIKKEEIPANLPRTNVPGHLQGLWMYGQFSTKEYWSQNPSTYIGNGFTLAIAFKFNADGTYEQYFTSSAVLVGAVTYHQSVTKGTVEIDAATNTIITHPYKSHYKRTRSGVTEEERDMLSSEMDDDRYTFTTGTEPSGSKALYLTLEGTTQPVTFILRP